MLHKAENVQSGKRDVMVITFGAIPEKVEKDSNTYFDYYEKNSEIVWNKNGQYTKIYKPKNFKSTIKLLINFFSKNCNFFKLFFKYSIVNKPGKFSFNSEIL